MFWVFGCTVSLRRTFNLQSQSLLQPRFGFFPTLVMKDWLLDSLDCIVLSTHCVSLIVPTSEWTKRDSSPQKWNYYLVMLLKTHIISFSSVEHKRSFLHKVIIWLQKIAKRATVLYSPFLILTFSWCIDF